MNDHIPLTERDHVLIDVKAKPSGGLRPALTPTPGAALRATSGTPANRRSTISGLYGFRGLPVRLVLISAVFGGVVGVGVAPALAVTANSQNKNFTVGGKGYINRAYVNTDIHTASTTILRNNATNIPAGYMGVKVRVFWDSGTCAQPRRGMALTT